MDKITNDLNKLVNMYSWNWDFIKHIENYSREHKENFNEKYKGFRPIIETSIEILNSTLEILKHSNRKNWKWYYWTQYLLILNTIPFLYWSYKNIIDWFYIQSSMNLRWAFESLLRLYFINFNPTNFNLIFGNEAKKQLKEKWKIVKSYPEFKIKDFIEKDLKTIKWLEIYHILSNESHSNIISIINDMAEIEKWDYDIFADLKGKINVEFNINLLLMVIYAFFRYIDEVLIKNTIFDKQEIEKQRDEIFKTKEFLMKILEKSLLDEYKKEIDNIMKIILDNKNKI